MEDGRIACFLHCKFTPISRNSQSVGLSFLSEQRNAGVSHNPGTFAGGDIPSVLKDRRTELRFLIASQGVLCADRAAGETDRKDHKRDYTLLPAAAMGMRRDGRRAQPFSGADHNALATLNPISKPLTPRPPERRHRSWSPLRRSIPTRTGTAPDRHGWWRGFCRRCRYC